MGPYGTAMSTKRLYDDPGVSLLLAGDEEGVDALLGHQLPGPGVATLHLGPGEHGVLWICPNHGCYLL